MKIILNEPLNHGLSKFSDVRYQDDCGVYNNYDDNLGKTILEQFNSCSSFGSDQVKKALEQFRIEGTSITLDQMNRHKPISFYTSGDINYGALDYPCPRSISGNVMTLTRMAKERYETFEHQMFSNLWENSGALQATWGKVPITPLHTNWKRNYLKLKDEVFIFEGPRHFLSTGFLNNGKSLFFLESGTPVTQRNVPRHGKYVSAYLRRIRQTFLQPQ